MTMTLIEHIPVGSGGLTAIEFTSIPQSYTDLYIVASLRETGSSITTSLVFNNDSTNQSSYRLDGFSSSTVTSSTGTFRPVISYTSDTANTFGSLSIYISNYAGSNPKTLLIDSVSESNSTTAYRRMMGGVWNDTSAITAINLEGVSGASLVEYGSATLYGITAGSDGTTTVS